jgi:hypothetical protein
MVNRARTERESPVGVPLKQSRKSARGKRAETKFQGAAIANAGVTPRPRNVRISL